MDRELVDKHPSFLAPWRKGPGLLPHYCSKTESVSQVVVHSLTHLVGFPPFLVSFLSLSPALWDALPNQLLVPKSLTQSLHFAELKDSSLCVPGSMLGRGD